MENQYQEYNWDAGGWRDITPQCTAPPTMDSRPTQPIRFSEAIVRAIATTPEIFTTKFLSEFIVYRGCTLAQYEILKYKGISRRWISELAVNTAEEGLSY